MLLLTRYAGSKVIIVTITECSLPLFACYFFSFFILSLAEKAISLDVFSLLSRFSSVKVMSEAKVRWIDKFLWHAHILEI